MKKVSKKVLALAMILSIAFVSVAQQGNGNGKGNKAYRGQGNNETAQCQKGDRMASYLDLTEEQQAQIKTLRLEHKKAMLPLQNQMNEVKAKLQTLSTTDNADMKAINAQIDKMGNIRTQMMKSKAAHKQEVRKLLNDEQRILFDSHKGRGGKGHKGGGKGNGNGKGCNRM